MGDLKISFLHFILGAKQDTKLNFWLKLTSKDCAASSDCQTHPTHQQTAFFTHLSCPGRQHWIHQQSADNIMLTNLILPCSAAGLNPWFYASVKYLCVICLFAISSTQTSTEFTESQDILGWKEPAGIIKSRSWMAPPGIEPTFLAPGSNQPR